MQAGAHRYVSGAQICAALGGRWTRGHHGTARCPAHDDRSPSLSVRETQDHRPLVHCFAGCPQERVIAALHARGLWWAGETVVDAFGWSSPAPDGLSNNTERKRREKALAIWDRARPISTTKAQAYLRARGIRLPPSDQLRYAPSLEHWATKQSFPAMIARISDGATTLAVQRTYLDSSTSRKAPVENPKMTLGPMESGAVRLREPHDDRLGLAEGIETALSAMQLYAVPVWAVCGASRFTSVKIPDSIRFLSIFGDSGAAGKAEAFKAAEFWERTGRHVEIYFPAAHFGDADDFNSVLQSQT